MKHVTNKGTYSLHATIKMTKMHYQEAVRDQITKTDKIVAGEDLPY